MTLPFLHNASPTVCCLFRWKGEELTPADSAGRPRDYATPRPAHS